MSRWNAPKLTQGAVMAILVAATGTALAWLAHAPERGATPPQPPVPPATVPPLGAPRPGPAPGEPALPAAAPRGGNDPAAADPGLADAEPTESAPPAHTSPWRVLDADTYSLTPATVPLHARLPGAYEWPLPAIDRLEPICFHRPDGPAHLGIMQADGRLYHWGEERRFLQEHLDAASIDSREIRTVADPGAFMQPLRAAAHAACERSLPGADTPDAQG